MINNWFYKCNVDKQCLFSLGGRDIFENRVGEVPELSSLEAFFPKVRFIVFISRNSRCCICDHFVLPSFSAMIGIITVENVNIFMYKYLDVCVYIYIYIYIYTYIFIYTYTFI